MTLCTVEEFLAMNPGQRLKFALKLGDTVTPEVVALLVHTYLTTEMHDQTRGIYRDQLMTLIGKVNPIALVALAYRFVNTSTAAKVSPAMLRTHQDMSQVFTRLFGGCSYGYFSRALGSNNRMEYFLGTLSRRILPTNLEELLAQRLQHEDYALYDRDAVRWTERHTRGYVPMILVPMNDQLPATLGLEPAR